VPLHCVARVRIPNAQLVFGAMLEIPFAIISARLSALTSTLPLHGASCTRWPWTSAKMLTLRFLLCLLYVFPTLPRSSSSSPPPLNEYEQHPTSASLPSFHWQPYRPALPNPFSPRSHMAHTRALIAQARVLGHCMPPSDLSCAQGPEIELAIHAESTSLFWRAILHWQIDHTVKSAGPGRDQG
jgi:hypothetical protein